MIMLQKTLLTRPVVSIRFAVILLAFFFLPVSDGSAQEKTKIASPASGGKTKISAALQVLIQEIEQNEALYKNLQVNMTCSEVDQANLTLYDGPKPIQRQSKISITVQGEMFRNRNQTKGRFISYHSLGLYWLQDGYRPTDSKKIVDDPPQIQVDSGTQENTDVFNGTTFRSFWKDIYAAKGKDEQPRIQKKGLISDQTTGLINLARPHMLLLELGGPRVPLSIFLKGTEAVSAFTGNSKSKSTTRVQIRGTEKIQGLECTTVRLETFDSTGKPRVRRDLWLARDRNLIPIRSLSFTYHISTELPNTESLVEAWYEVRPGVWFPRKTHTERYNSIILKREGRQQSSWRKEYIIESVELDPQLPDDNFTKLDFEAGTRVNVFQGNKMTKNFKQK